MARVFLGMGANLSPATNIPAGIERLSKAINIKSVSPCYESAAIGFTGPAFINLVIEAHTEMSVAQLNRSLKEIEAEFGRKPDTKKYSDRALDIDILIVDELNGDIDGISLPRVDVWRYAFVLRPLLDIWPNGVCPRNKIPISNYWTTVAHQTLREVTLEGLATTSNL